MSPENEENAGENSSNSSAGKIEEEVPTIITREYLRELDRRVYPVKKS